jgi:hypothetical protein
MRLGKGLINSFNTIIKLSSPKKKRKEKGEKEKKRKEEERKKGK